MQNILALDIGRKHTGVAYADSLLRVPVPLKSLHHDTVEELVNEVSLLVSKKGVEKVIVGLPLVASGAEGKQATFTKGVLERLREVSPHCSFETLDERWTSKAAKKEEAVDEHAQAAVKLLSVFLARTM